MEAVTRMEGRRVGRSQEGEGESMKQYRLGSAEFVSAPGLIRWAINGAAFEDDARP